MGDVAERALWDKYQAAYQETIRYTASRNAPWYVVPADHKWFARAVIGTTIVGALESLDLQFPKVDTSEAGELEKARKALTNERRSAVSGRAVAQPATKPAAPKAAQKPAPKPAR
jgi:hypothetical protein